MIRLNGFFTVRPEKREEFLAMAEELVNASRQDAGCKFYALVEDVFQANKMMFVETWEDDTSLAAHSAAEHFTRIVPQLKDMTEFGMRLERFDF